MNTSVSKKPKPRKGRFLVYVVFVLLVGLCGGAIYMVIVKLRPQTDASTGAQKLAVSDTSVSPAQQAVPAVKICDAKEALVSWQAMAKLLNKGDSAAVWQHSIHPDDPDLRDRALLQLENDAAAMASGELTLKVLDAQGSGDWTMIALLRNNPEVEITQLVLLHDGDDWRIVPEAAFSNQKIMQRIDSPYDALADWFQSSLASWEEKHLPDQTDSDSMILAASASAIETVEEPVEAAMDKNKPTALKTVDSSSAKDAWLAGLKAANGGEYEQANKLIDISRQAVDEGETPTAQDLIDYWDELTEDRSYRPKSIKIRRTKVMDDKVNIMLRARLKDGNSRTVKVDLQQIDSRWVLVKEY